METVEEKKQKIRQLVDSLPPERLGLAEALLEQLRHEARVEVKQGKRIVRLGGLWKDLGVEITEEDIAQARQEMWRRMGEGDE
jgi:hypothetical protein